MRTPPRSPEKSCHCRPSWNFDGSSTNQAPGEDSEVIIKPRAIYPDPFRGGDNIMVMCDCYKPNGEPLKGNTRKECAEVMDKVRLSRQLLPTFDDILGRRTQGRVW